ncbi:hypothetical protein C8R48DRAFT_694924 [Suillus tomentosus]|nr:hypothetical protein C8R48DRAFT_694924 [Suillus tomentosus]
MISAFARSPTPRTFITFVELSCWLCSIYTLDLCIAPDTSIQCRPFNWSLLDRRLHRGNEGHTLHITADLSKIGLARVSTIQISICSASVIIVFNGPIGLHQNKSTRCAL